MQVILKLPFLFCLLITKHAVTSSSCGQWRNYYNCENQGRFTKDVSFPVQVVNLIAFNRTGWHSNRNFNFYTEEKSIKSTQLALLLEFVLFSFLFIYLSYISPSFPTKSRSHTTAASCSRFVWLSTVSAVKYRDSIANWATITSFYILPSSLFNHHLNIHCSKIWAANVLRSTTNKEITVKKWDEVE
jgi:hypothetical protein